MRARHSTSLAVTLVVGTLACAGSDDGAVATAVRDSAGVVIVENTGSIQVGEGGFTVVPEPLVSIGSLEGDTLQQLYRVNGAIRLADGRIAVGNGGSGQLRIYAPDGRFLASLGRPGEGPGEFRAVALVGALGGDTLVTLDSDLRRISLFHLETGFVRSARVVDEAGGFLLARGAFADGSIVAGGGFFFSSGAGQISGGAQRSPTSFASVDLDGRLITDFGEFPGLELFIRLREGGLSANLLPYGKFAVAAVSSDRLYVGTADRYEIRAFAPDGRLARLIRYDQPTRPVTPADIDAYIEEQVAEGEQGVDPQEIRTRYREMPAPERMPAYQQIATDVLGHLWVSEYRLPGDDTPVWTVFDPEGGLVARLALPPRVGVLEIGEDYLLGRLVDELDVEYVQLFRLERP